MAQGDFTRINTNIGALNALNSLKNINTQMGVRQLRLATGKRINEAAEDPAGLTIATKFKYRASGLGVALDNIGDAKNLLAVAEGGLSKINDILVQVRDKTLQAANDALGTDERTAIKSQISSYLTQIDNIVAETKWNGQSLIAGNVSKSFQTGADASEKTDLTLAKSFKHNSLNITLNATATVEALNATGNVTSFASASLGGGTAGGAGFLAAGTYKVQVVDAAADTFSLLNENGVAVNISDAADGSGDIATVVTASGNTYDTGRGIVISLTADDLVDADGGQVIYATAGAVDSNTTANAYLGKVNEAIKTVSKAISDLGALTARLTFKEETLSVAKVNTEAAHNRIMNADMAYEQLESTKLGILQQTATAMLSQANQGPQSVLSLFR